MHNLWEIFGILHSDRRYHSSSSAAEDLNTMKVNYKFSLTQKGEVTFQCHKTRE